ncbi:unnamed protein product [Owenia fusiformis]|uniref:Uncharacterized protein n=1 Tax=Owenia fusiformis TaxID=6347 RepID=A0A8S4Q4J8_OWEFU|nr:unnamed protein product [Owenia fusiformis]
MTTVNLYRQIKALFGILIIYVMITSIYFINTRYSKIKQVVYEQVNLMDNKRPSTRQRNDEGNKHHIMYNQTLLSALTQGYWKPKNVAEIEKDMVTSKLKRWRMRKKIEYSNDTTCGHAYQG